MPIKIASKDLMTKKTYSVEYVENNPGVYMYTRYNMQTDNIKTISLGRGIVFHLGNNGIIGPLERPSEWVSGFHKLDDAITIEVAN